MGIAITQDTPPTERQLEIYNFYVAFRQRHGYAPTYREAAEVFSVTIKTIVDHVRALEKRNYIKRAGMKSRAISFPRLELLNKIVIAGRAIDVGFMDGGRHITGAR